MPLLTSRPDTRYLWRPLGWLLGICVGLVATGYLMPPNLIWLTYLIKSLAMVLMALGAWVGVRWKYLHPQLQLSPRGIELRWPWRKRLIHWREVLRIQAHEWRQGGWLMGQEEGYRVEYGINQQCFISLRYQPRPEALEQWLTQIAAQLPLHGDADVADLPVDPKLTPKPSPPRPALRLPKTYDGPLWYSSSLWTTALWWGIAIWLLWLSLTDGPEELKWLAGFMGALSVSLCYIDYHRFTLEGDALRVVKRLWFDPEVSILLFDIEQVLIQQRYEQPRSMLILLKDGKRRRFVAGQLTKAVWVELAYDLAALGVPVHLDGDFSKWLEH